MSTKKAGSLCVWIVCLAFFVLCASGQENVANKDWADLMIINKCPINIYWPSIDFFLQNEVIINTTETKIYPLRALTYQISRNESHLIMSFGGVAEKQFPVEPWIVLLLDNKPIKIGSKFNQFVEGGRTYNLTAYA